MRQNSELKDKAVEDLELKSAHAEIEKLNKDFELERRESLARMASLEEEIRDLKKAVSQQQENTSNAGKDY